MNPYFLLGLLSIIGLFLIWFSIKNLRSTHGGDVHIIWYIFSLAGVTTILLGIWAARKGWIDSNGSLEGEVGHLINAALVFMLDLEADFVFFGVILILFALPQLISYVLSGVYGCASSPLFLSSSVTFVVWSAIKSMVTAAGILVGVALLCFFYRWPNFGGSKSMTFFSLGLLLLSFAFLYLYQYYEAKAIVNWIVKWLPKKSIILAESIHSCATKHRQD